MSSSKLNFYAINNGLLPIKHGTWNMPLAWGLVERILITMWTIKSLDVSGPWWWKGRWMGLWKLFAYIIFFNALKSLEGCNIFLMMAWSLGCIFSPSNMAYWLSGFSCTKGEPYKYSPLSSLILCAYEPGFAPWVRSGSKGPRVRIELRVALEQMCPWLSLCLSLLGLCSLGS